MKAVDEFFLCTLSVKESKATYRLCMMKTPELVGGGPVGCFSKPRGVTLGATKNINLTCSVKKGSIELVAFGLQYKRILQ